MKKRFHAVLLLMLAGFSASAQFYAAGDDPGGLKWHSISSDHFRIVYPAGNDSLALRYGMELERYRLPLASSIGYSPNGLYRRPMPVILHSHTATANGSVTWAPRRMDLFTRPDASSPEPLDWITELAVHESRHVAQMQFARGRGFGVFNGLVGELFTGAMAALYPGPALLEGDAVTAETALTGAGRGRSADFLEHMRVSFAYGDFRDWYRWRWGSQKLYTPDHYRAGYMLVAGTRYLYDDPLFTKRYYDNIFSARLPLPFFVLQKTLRQASGKGLKDTWQEIAAAQQALWAADEAARGPFGPARPLTPPGRRYTEYLSPENAAGSMYAILRGITTAPKLVRISDDGHAGTVRPLSSTTEQIRYSEATGRLFWSEIVPDPRWTLASGSRIFYLEPGSRKARQLTRDGNLYNPSPDPSGTAIAVTEYPVRGGSAVVVLDGTDGRELRRYPAPDSLQVVETAWDGRLVASAVSPAGFGLYDVADGYKPLLAPRPVKIKQLRSSREGILFVCDAGGVNELYRLEKGFAVRLTNHRFGASDFLPSGDSLTFSALTPSGRLLHREAFPHQATLTMAVTPGSNSIFLNGSPIVLSSSPSSADGTPAPSPWPVAERLSEQERRLAADSPAVPNAGQDLFSAPKPYHKLPHLLRLHSWAPLYIDYNDIASLSLESVSSSAGLGATAFFQNDLGTATAIVGYSASPFTEDETRSWAHSVHGQFTYRGWYPVIELSGELGGRDARQYIGRTIIHRSARNLYLEGSDIDLPYFRTAARIYVPLDYSRSGWSRGLVPRIDATLSNDMVNTAEVYNTLIQMIGEKPGIYRVGAGASEGRNVPLARVTAGIRGYAMLGRARSAIYPRWGFGAEAGASLRPGTQGMFSPSAFLYLYGYIPGLMDTHGIRLSVMHQTRLDGRIPDNYVNSCPRGLSDVSGLSAMINARYGSQTRLTADYALPLLPLDWSSLGPVAYVRNFELTLHADADILSSPLEESFIGSGAYSIYQKESASAQIAPTVVGRSGTGAGMLYSAGADLAVRLGNFLWIPYATRIGVSYNFCGSTIPSSDLTARDITLPCHRLSLIFSVDLP